MLWNVVSLACLGLLAAITYFVKGLPIFYREMKLEQRRAENSQELQREAYFREYGGKDLAKLFKDWAALLYDSDKMKNFSSKNAADLISRTIIYGSTRTINLCSNYTRDLYDKKLEKTPGEELGYGEAKTLLYFAFIISSLKFDFTGYEVDPMRLLQVKVNDLSDREKEQSFKDALEDIKREDIRM